MSHTKAPCQARQHSDQMTCSACDITWDMNDRNPPNCRPSLITVTPIIGPDVVGHETNIMGEITRQVAYLQDKVVHDSLVKLGWTPPGHAPAPKRSSCRAAMVDPGNHWRPITPQTPRGVKMWLIRKAAGVATTGTIGTHETFFDHWAPIATFSKS